MGFGWRMDRCRRVVISLGRLRTGHYGSDLPNLPGADLARKLLEIRPDIPIILVTGFSESVTLPQIQKIGIRDLVMKPIAIQGMSILIRHLLEPGEDKPPQFKEEEAIP